MLEWRLSYNKYFAICQTYIYASCSLLPASSARWANCRCTAWSVSNSLCLISFTFPGYSLYDCLKCNVWEATSLWIGIATLYAAFVTRTASIMENASSLRCESTRALRLPPNVALDLSCYALQILDFDQKHVLRIRTPGKLFSLPHKNMVPWCSMIVRISESLFYEYMCRIKPLVQLQSF